MVFNRQPISGETWAFAPSKIHGRGLFARLALPGGTRILEYVGEQISKTESLRRCELQNEYIFSLSNQFDLDGNVEWNPARFLNHSCEPNCEALLEDERIWIVSIRDIAAGEELTFNYGYDLEDYRKYPCNCGAATCIGFMVAEEFFDYVRRHTAACQPKGERDSQPTYQK
jgi:SET domain-containing protein